MKPLKPKKQSKPVGPLHPKPLGKKNPLALECTHYPKNPKYGQQVVYTITFTNPNKTAVTSVKIEYDQSSGMYPSYINFISATNGGSMQGTTKVVWTLGTLGPGESGIVSFTLGMHDGMDPNATLSYSASVSISSAQTSQTSIPYLTEVMGWQDLNWVVSCPAIVHRGQTFQYIISIFNNCTTMVTALRGHVSFSPHITFLEYCSSAGDPVVEDLLGSLPAGQSMTFIAKVKVNSNAPLGSDVICVDCNFLSDESVGAGSGICTSCQ
jgi:uncharacterized repeat protein (TIGR01451 family)